MIAPTIDARLICASECCYFIGKDGGFTPSNVPKPYYDAVGFTATPKAFVGGLDAIDACLVGPVEGGVVLAFRGTLPFDIHNIQTLIDWINDFNAVLRKGAGLPGLVHDGFLGSLDSLWDRANAEVKSLFAAAGPGAVVHVTGHSKGGGMAPLAAWRLSQNEGLPVEVVTFAAPRPGDEPFARAYNAALPGLTRYEYADDIVPHTPPDDELVDALSRIPIFGHWFSGLGRFDYHPVGQLRFINWSGKIVGNSLALQAERFLHLAELVLTLRFRQIAADHSIGCGTGYMSAVGPGVCKGL